MIFLDNLVYSSKYKCKNQEFGGFSYATSEKYDATSLPSWKVKTMRLS